MAKSLNRAQLIGNVGKEPEVRKTGTGTKVAEFSIATGRQWTGQDGQKKEKTEWHRCVAWDKLAAIVESYVGKGDRLYVEGEIQYRSYEKDGDTRYVTEIVVQNLVMLGGNGEREERPTTPKQQARRDSYQPDPGAKRQAEEAFGPFDDDDDLPF